MPVKLSIIIVTFNGENHIQNCIHSIYKYLPKEYFEIILSDNLSTDNTVKIVKENFPDVKIIIGENKGYGSGMNKGMKLAQGDYFLILNDDTYFIDDSLIKMVEFIESKPKAGLVGPLLLNTDRSLQPSITNYPRILKDMLQILFPYMMQTDNLIFKTILRGMRNYLPLGRYDFHDSIKKVESIKGACILIRKDVFQQTGGFDENIFLDTEESTLSKRAELLGWETCFFPEAKLVHIGGVTIGDINLFKFSPRVLQKYKSNIYYFKVYKSNLSHMFYIILMIISISIRLFNISIISLMNSRINYKKERNILIALVKMFASKRIRELNMLTDNFTRI